MFGYDLYGFRRKDNKVVARKAGGMIMIQMRLSASRNSLKPLPQIASEWLEEEKDIYSRKPQLFDVYEDLIEYAGKAEADCVLFCDEKGLHQWMGDKWWKITKKGLKLK